MCPQRLGPREKCPPAGNPDTHLSRAKNLVVADAVGDGWGQEKAYPKCQALVVGDFCNY